MHTQRTLVALVLCALALCVKAASKASPPPDYNYDYPPPPTGGKVPPPSPKTGTAVPKTPYSPPSKVSGTSTPPSPKAATGSPAPKSPPSPSAKTPPAPKASASPAAKSPPVVPPSTNLTKPLTTICPTLVDAVATDKEYAWLKPALPTGALGPLTLLLPLPLNVTHSNPKDLIIPGDYKEVEELVAAKSAVALSGKTIKFVGNADKSVTAEFNATFARTVLPGAESYGSCSAFLLEEDM